MAKIASLLLLLSLSINAWGRTNPQYSTMDYLNTEDRIATYNRLRSATIKARDNCEGWQNGDDGCGRLSDIPTGDPSFNDPNYSHIQRGTGVRVTTQCDEQTGRFFTTIHYQKERGGKYYPFKNPESDAHTCNNQSFTMDGFQNTSQNWITSPGYYTYYDPTVPGEYVGSRRTKIPAKNPGEGYISRLHVVSDNKSYAGTHMPWAVWVRGGFAYHAASPNAVDGLPQSQGCFRLCLSNARALYRLIQKAGTANTTFHWKGYGSTQSDGLPKCVGTYTDGSPRFTGTYIANRPDNSHDKRYTSAQARNNIFRDFGNSIRNLFRRKPKRKNNQPSRVVF